MKRKVGTLVMARGDGHDSCREKIRELEAELAWRNDVPSRAKVYRARDEQVARAKARVAELTKALRELFDYVTNDEGESDDWPNPVIMRKVRIVLDDLPDKARERED